MFNRFTSRKALAIYFGIGIYLALAYFGAYWFVHHDDVHMFVSQTSLHMDDIPGHIIQFDKASFTCFFEDFAPNGDSLGVEVPDAIPTYIQHWNFPINPVTGSSFIIESCETRQ